MPNHKKLSDEGKIKLTLDRFAPMKVGLPPEPYLELSKKYHLSEKTIQAAISDAFQRGLVIVQGTRLPPVYKESAYLEALILEKYRFLHTAVVIDVNAANADGEVIHRSLGHAMAHRIHHSAIKFQPSGVIGIGTGRAVHYTAEALARLPPLSVSDITVMSLTGSFFMLTSRTIDQNNMDGGLVDADTNTALLLKYFRGPVNMKPISFPIAHSLPTRDSVIRHTWLHAPEYNRHTPSHAIIGLGMFSEDNGLVQEVRRSKEGRSPALEPIWPELRKLIENIDSVRNAYPDYCPVGDICNHLFLVPPPPSVKIDNFMKRMVSSIKESISIINNMLLTADAGQLRKIRNVMLVAGTMQKAGGIRHILNNEHVFVHALCVDREVAQYLLETD
jgi:hypothetical protein